MATFDQWEAQYLAGVKRSKIGKDDRGREAQIIKTYLDAYRVRLSQYAALPPEKVAAFMEQAEKNLDRDIMRRFPPRTSANSSSANAYTR